MLRVRSADRAVPDELAAFPGVRPTGSAPEMCEGMPSTRTRIVPETGFSGAFDDIG